MCSKSADRTILQALYLGGFEGVNKLFRLGQVQPHQAQILLGSAAWTPGQLHNEVWAGYWYVVAASSTFLHDCVFGKLCKKAYDLCVSIIICVTVAIWSFANLTVQPSDAP